MKNNHETDDDHFDKFLSAYPGYVKKDYPLLVPPGMMDRVNAALERMRPSREEWAREFQQLKEAQLAGVNGIRQHRAPHCPCRLRRRPRRRPRMVP